MRCDHDGGLEQVAAVLREDLAAARLADLVAGPADPLQAARDRARRLHLDHEVDRAHVDAELERATSRRCPRRRPAFSASSTSSPLLARERPVVGAHEVLLGQLVEPRRQALGQAAGVHEHDRRAVRADQLQQLRVDRGPDRRALAAVAAGSSDRVRRSACRAPPCPRPGRPPRSPSACGGRRRRS